MYMKKKTMKKMIGAFKNRLERKITDSHYHMRSSWRRFIYELNKSSIISECLKFENNDFFYG